MGDMLTIPQLKQELGPAFKTAVEEALAGWKLPEPKPPVTAAQEPSFPKFLDVTIDGQPRKAELLDPQKGVYAAQAGMSQGLAGLVEAGDSLRILNVHLPLASVAVGFAGGMVLGNVIDVVVPPPADIKADPLKAALNFGAQGAAVWATMKYGPGLVGSTASKFAAGVIIFRVLMRLLPIQKWTDDLTGIITKPVLGFTGTGMRQLAAGQGYGQLGAAQGYEQSGSGVQSEVYRGTI